MQDAVKERLGLVSFVIILAMMLVSLNLLVSLLGDDDIYVMANVSLESVGLVAITILSTVVLIEPVADRRRILFIALMFSEAVMLMADIVFWYTLNHIDQYVSGLLWSFAQCMQIVVYMCFLAHVYEAYLGWTPGVRRMLYALASILLVSAVLGLTNTWTGFSFAFDSDGFVDRRAGHYLMAAFLCAVAACTTYSLRKHGGIEVTTAMQVLFMLLPIFGFMLQNVVEDISFSLVFLSYASAFIVSSGYVRRGNEIEINRDMQDMQYAEALTRQIAPHFMFNSLSSIMNLPGNDDRSREVIEDFSTYLRNTLDTILLTEPVPIRRELEQVETFVSLKRIAYGDRLNISYEIHDSGFRIPSLTIRTILSYFIRDNLDMEGAPLYVSISTHRVGDIHRVVIDNKTGTPATRSVFRGIIEDPRRSVLADRIAMMCSGTIRHILTEGSSMSIIIEIPEVSQ